MNNKEKTTDKNSIYTPACSAGEKSCSAGEKVCSADKPVSAGEKAYALVLAGGKSSRMGRDKSLIRIDGQTMLETAVKFWKDSGEVEKVLVACGSEEHYELIKAELKKTELVNEALEDAEQVKAYSEELDFEPVFDVMDARGPMCGLLSAFTATDADILYVSAVDMPWLEKRFILKPPVGDAAVYVLDDGKYEPLFGVYRRTVADEARRQLTEGRGRMADLLDAVKTDFVPADPSMTDLFNNLNTPDQLSNFIKSRSSAEEKQ